MDKTEIIRLYEQNMSLVAIGKQTGLHINTVRNYLKKNTNYTSNKRSRDLEQKVIDLYNDGMTSGWEISKKLNLNYSTIFTIFKRLKLDNTKKEKYELDENFFERIDTEEKAYLLGVLYSDGCVYKNTMIIGVTDKEIVENAKKFLKYEGNIETYKKDNKCKVLYKLRIRRKKIFDDLTSKGCVPNKSLILTFPDYNIVPKELMNHFIRGIFCGDGCICQLKNEKYKGRWSVGITGTKEILKEIIQEIGLSCKIINRTKNKNTWVFQLYKTKEIEAFLNYIYKDAHVYLTRKKDLADRFLREENV